MTAPSGPIEIDLPPGSTALVLNDEGLVVYRNDKQSVDDGNNGSKLYRRDHDAMDAITLDDDGISPPLFGEFRVSTEISAPVKRVFDYVADIKTHEEYADFVDSVKITSESTVGEDVTFVQKHEGSTEVLKSEFELYEPHDCVGWVVRRQTGDLHIRYWFDSLDSETGITHAGIFPLSDDSLQAFSQGLEEIQTQYKNNVDEMVTLRSILE
jgi:hypothetical protein